MSETEFNINAVSKDAMNEFIKAKDDIIKETVKRSLEREDEVLQHGEKAEELIKSGIEFTTKMLISAMSMGEIALLEDELQWAKDRLPHDKVELKHVLVRLQIYKQVISKILPPNYAKEINAYLNWMIQRQNELIDESKI